MTSSQIRTMREKGMFRRMKFDTKGIRAVNSEIYHILENIGYRKHGSNSAALIECFNLAMSIYTDIHGYIRYSSAKRTYGLSNTSTAIDISGMFQYSYDTTVVGPAYIGINERTLTTVRDLYLINGERVRAIKYIRNEYGLSLKEAQEFVESVQYNN